MAKKHAALRHESAATVRLVRRGLLGLTLGVAITLSASAFGQDAATQRVARDLARDGVALLKEGKYAEAQEKLHRAYELFPAPTVALFEGEALEQLGRLVEAAERYEAARLAELPENAHSALRSAVERAGQSVARLTPIIPRLTVHLDGADADTPGLEVTLDGKALPSAMIGVSRPVDPGEHEVLATLNGQPLSRDTITLARGQTDALTLRVKLPAQSAPPPASGAVPTARSAGGREAVGSDDAGGLDQTTWGYVGLGVGGIGLVTGVVAGLVMLRKDSTLEAHCTPRCPPEYEDDLNAFETSRTLSFIGYGVGVVGVAAGVTLLLTAPSDDRAAGAGEASVGAWMAPGQIGVRGRF